MKTTRWGIIGPGKIANKFATALKMTEAADLVAIASRDHAKATAFVAAHGDPTHIKIHNTYEALASDPDVDAVYIATPHGYHAEHATLCLRNGKAVLCEKPLALNAHEVTQMIEASQQHRAFLMEAMWTRFIPLTGAIMELVSSGKIGTIKYIRADFGFLAPFNPDGRLYNMRLGGGSLLDIGIYPLYLCLQLLGAPNSITAAGKLSPTGSDETCHALLLYDNGASAVVSSTLTCQTSLTAEIAGTEGMIRIPSPWYKNDQFEWNRTGEPAQTVQLEPMVNGFEYQVREAKHCMDQKLIESPSLPHSFSLMMSETMDAIRSQIGVRYLSDRP